MCAIWCDICDIFVCWKYSVTCNLFVDLRNKCTNSSWRDLSTAASSQGKIFLIWNAFETTLSHLISIPGGGVWRNYSKKNEEHDDDDINTITGNYFEHWEMENGTLSTWILASGRPIFSASLSLANTSG